MCRAQFIEIKSLGERVATQEKVNIHDCIAETKVEVKNTARSVSANCQALRDNLATRLDARMDKLEALMGNTDVLERDGVTLEGLWALREMTGLHNRMREMGAKHDETVRVLVSRINQLEAKTGTVPEIEIKSDDESDAPPRYSSLAGGSSSEAGQSSETMTTFGPMTARELATAREMVTQYLAISRNPQ